LGGGAADALRPRGGSPGVAAGGGEASGAPGGGGTRRGDRGDAAAQLSHHAGAALGRDGVDRRRRRDVGLAAREIEAAARTPLAQRHCVESRKPNAISPSPPNRYTWLAEPFVPGIRPM